MLMKISFTLAEKEALVGVLYRSVIGIGSAIFFWIFRQELPFPFPHIAILSLITPLYNILVLVFLLLHKYPEPTYVAPIYIDSVLISIGIYLSGGFVSPFLVVGLVTMFGSGIIFTNRRDLGKHIFTIILCSYVLISLGTKFGFLPALTPYERELLTNTPFFLVSFMVVSSAYIMGYVIMRIFAANVHQTLADVFYAHEKILASATPAEQARGGLHEIVEHLGRALQGQFACAAELLPEQKEIRIVAFWSLSGEKLEERQLEIQGTIYEQALTSVRACWNGRFGPDYAKDPLIRQLGFQGLRGHALRNTEGNPVGLICVMNKGELPPVAHADSIMTVFAARAGSELLRLLADRERQRMQEELVQAQKMEAVGHLASGIAHDFNNMLGAILGFAELLWRKSEKNSPSRAYVDRIMVTARRGSELTKQMLAFARKGKYRNAPVDLHGLLAEIIFMLEHTLGKRIRIRLERNATEFVTRGDPSQLQNMIINLSINARDAMSNGGTLTIATETIHVKSQSQTQAYAGFSVQEGTYCMLSVRDTGSGIPPEMMPHIFEPFFTSRPRGRGTGLGLASVYGCVKSHNGFIELHNQVGRGVEFRIYLPVIAESDVVTVRQKQLADAPKPAVQSRIRALLVDDEQEALDCLGAGLREMGWVVHPFENGPEALAFYRAHFHEIDLAVLDMIMPEMGGKELFFKLREVNPEVVAIIASGYSKGAESEELLAAGAASYFEKPFSASELAAEAQKTLKARASCRDAAT